MPLERDSYVVYVNDPDGGEPREVTAVITHQDRLRGEKAHLDAAGAKYDEALGLTTAWCWASLMRQGDYAGAYQQFRDFDCAGIERGDPVVVDPTRPVTNAG